jgi:hypothetical protein
MLHNLPKLRLIESGRTFSYATRVNLIRCPRIIIPDVLQNTKNVVPMIEGLAKSFLTAQYGSHYVVYCILYGLILLNNI